MTSVVYQESANNFTDTRQNIKGAQITTIKTFGVGIPTGSGDFLGQLGVANTAQGESLMYVYNGVEWKLVGQSGNANLPDEVVMEDRKNNFTEVDQRIEDCQITYVDTGTRLVDQVAIKGVGHIYVYEAAQPKLYMSFDGTSWTQLNTEHDKVEGDVKLDAANNFTNPDQTIFGRNIINIIKGAQPAPTSGVVPTREGELYIQTAENTLDRIARMWVSNNSGGWKWEPLTHIYELPATVVQISKGNNFEATNQTIAGKQIMSFIDGGDQNPGASGAIPDYDGQFYVAVKTRINGTKDIAIWVAQGNQWLPIQEDIDLATIVRNDISNRFSNPEQLLGEGGANARHLIGARHKHSGASPIADGNWRVQNIGEITIYENATVVPREVSIWVGVAKGMVSSANEWALVWSNKQGDVDNFARLDQANEFTPIQWLNSGGMKIQINGGHEGGVQSPKNVMTPLAPGDTYTQSYSHPSYGETRNIWIAAIEADSTSWRRILTEDDHEVILGDRKNNFLTKDNFIGAETDTKRKRIMGARVASGNSVIYNGVAPTMTGEVVINERWDENFPGDESKKFVEILLAVGTGRKSWIEIGRRLKSELEIIDDGTNN